MKMKSVMAGEYTAPPAHGPMTTETWGTTPDAITLRWKTSAYPGQRRYAFLDSGGRRNR